MEGEDQRASSSHIEQQDSRVRVEVTVGRAVDLPDVESPFKHAPDAYVVVSVQGVKKRTDTVKRSRSPEWNASFIFRCDLSAIVIMDVYASRTVRKNTLLGQISVPLRSFFVAADNDIQTHEREIAPGSDAKLRFTVKVTGETFDLEDAANDAVATAGSALTRMNLRPALSKPAEVVEGGKAVVEAVNAVGEAVSPISGFLDGLGIFCEIMDDITEVHPYAKAAWNILSLVYKTYKRQLDMDKNIRELFVEMTSLYTAMNELKREEGGEIRAMAKSQEDLLPRIVKETKECCEFIEKYASHPFASRIARFSLSSNGQRIKNYCSSFHQLKSEFHSALRWGVHLMAVRIWDGQQSLVMRTFLQSLPCAERASVLDLDPCLPNTRTEVLPEIRTWVNANNGQQVFLLTGPSGSGKSAIASSVAHHCKENSCLGASFAFRRGRLDRTADRLFPTIARDLAEYNDNICKALYDLVANDTVLRETENMTLQFKTYLVDSVADVTAAGPVVIVIDALDEGGDPGIRTLLLRLLAEQPAKRAPSLRFRIFITCRPEHDILKFANHPGVYWKSLDNVPSTNRDISRYIRWRLIPPNGPTLEGIDEMHCNQLAHASQCLFQYASVACAIVIGSGKGGRTPRERFERLMKDSTADRKGLLDSLYENILPQLLSLEDPETMVRFKTVMAIILVAFEPLSMTAINGILKAMDIDGEEFNAEIILGYLGSLLSGVSTTNDPIVPLHTSFRDFLTDSHIRSGKLFINLSDVHKQVVFTLLRILETELKFNICELETSYARNCDIPNLAKRISDHISVHLSYACRFSLRHVIACLLALIKLELVDDKLAVSLKALLTSNFLHWLEALSLLDAVPGVRMALLELEQLTNDEELRDLLNDLLAFLTIFGPAISDSAPHIYLSALSFAPPKSLVSKHFISQFPNTLQVGNPMSHWPNLRRSMQHGRPVLAVAISPNSQYVASGCSDGILWIWNAHSGMLIHGPLHGHQKYIKSITFSADSTLLATGSVDKTVHFWDVVKGEALGEPLVGHTDWVLSVTFNVQCSCILSASRDGIIRTWDIERAIAQTTQTSPTSMISSHSFQHNNILCTAVSSDGVHFASGGRDSRVMLWTIIPGEEECCGKVLLEHSDEVNCVTFSAESRYLASGSDDHTVHVWDLTTQEAVGDPLRGHTGWVRSVVFSPRDSTCLASGSGDSTIRIWSIAAGGHQLIRVLRGHVEMVPTLAYTVDGTHLVSGSTDGTARMWRVDGTEDPGNEEQTQSGLVWAACFSPDGASVVSGSEDGALRMWDAATGRALCQPLTGHTDRLRCVAVSRDGAHIVTGSDDKTLRWWDGKTYEAVGEPLDAQAGCIRVAVGFTKDGAQIIVIGWDGVRLFDAQTRELADDQLGDQLEGVYCGAISADGSLVACGVRGESDCDFRVWNLETRDVRCQFTLAREGYLLSMAFSPDGASLLVAIDSTVTRADVMTGVTAEWTTVDSDIWCLASSPAGNYVAAGTDNGSIHVWDYEAGALVARFVSPERAITAIAFSPDARQVAGGTWGGSFRLWDMPLENGGVSDSVKPIMFSSEREHALPNAERLFQSFSSHSTSGRQPIIQLGDDGWVKATIFSESGEESRLLFWVPAHYHQRLTILGRLPMNDMDPIHLDLRNFTHGRDWSRCTSQRSTEALLKFGKDRPLEN